MDVSYEQNGLDVHDKEFYYYYYYHGGTVKK